MYCNREQLAFNSNTVVFIAVISIKLWRGLPIVGYYGDKHYHVIHNMLK